MSNRGKPEEVNMENNPQVEVTLIHMEDPTFEGGSVHGAVAQITNNASAELTYSLELYLGAGKAATSGIVQAVIPAGSTISVPFSVTMPLDEGSYIVFLDARHGSTLLVHGQATEPVIITITPSVSIGDITWA